MPRGHALQEPLRLGTQTARNRVIFAPVTTSYGHKDGSVSPKQIEHYGRRASGGAGIVVTESFAISAAGRQLPRQVLVRAPNSLAGLTRLADEITRHGALAIVQVKHAGRYAGPWDVYEQERRLAPSAVQFELTPGRTVSPQAITEDEIEETVQHFGEAAALAQRAGFHGIDLHAAQADLLSSFLSPRMNQRSDRWGGDFGGRTALLRYAVREARRRTSGDFMVGLHLLSDELMPGGWSIEEAVRLVPLLAEDGADFVFPTPGTFESLRHPKNAGLQYRPGFAMADTRRIKAAADDLPRFSVIANGGLADPELAAGVLADGSADAVGLARAILVDPEWPAKVLEGKEDQIIGCPCDPPTCLRTQLTGAVCDHWPADALVAGFLGYNA